MKTKILKIDGKEKEEITLPKSFSAKIREDIVAKVLETKKREQPYSNSPVAGKQHSASGIIVHRRHVWKSGYGRGMSRIPRKILSRRGSQFIWVGAEVPNAVGGRRAHGPKILGKINTKKINKKEMKIAIESALSATANAEKILEKYESLKDKKITFSLPLVVESKLTGLKARELISSIKKILGKEFFEIAVKKKQVRKGKGKLRGRKYKKNLGMLIVVGNKEKIKTNAFDIVPVEKLSVMDLAKGGLGRLTLYTEQAIKELKEKLEK